MGNCDSSLNCTSNDSVIHADGGIVGGGVLAAFFATAALTVLAILFGYLSDSLPEWYLNDLDNAVISAYKKSCVSTKFVPRLWKGWSFLITTAKLSVGMKPSPSAQIMSRKARQEALSRFILTLSDQQLVTGLAILIAGVANQCRLTVYEFSIVLSLAWFSSTTHLATLDTLRDYFLAHKVVRNWRVACMLILLVFLSYSLFLTTFGSVFLPQSSPIQCYFSSSSSMIARGATTVDPVTVLSVLSTIVTLLIILPSYITGIALLYTKTGETVTWGHRLAFVVTGLPGRARNHRIKYEELIPFVKEATAKNVARSRLHRLQRIQKSSGLRRWGRITAYRSSSYHGSFLSKMPGIAFSFCYGLSQVVAYRWLLSSSLIIDKSPMDFGQMTAIFLLALPALAAAEIYYESRKKQSSTTDSHQAQSGIQVTTSDASNSEGIAKTYGTATDFVPQPSNNHVANHEPQGPEETMGIYESALPNIERYFYQESREIRESQTTMASEQDPRRISAAQASLFWRSQELKTFEDSLSLQFTSSLSLFVLDLASSVVLGILLNINPSPFVFAQVVIFFLIYYGGSVTGVTHMIYSSRKDILQAYWAYLEAKRLTKHQQPALSNYQGAEVSGPSVLTVTPSTISTQLQDMRLRKSTTWPT
ncbi:hypothetical protein AOQ84DRAFT_422468 [Glonium stellatum]|uniref:Uncharacterized protein n=1 Tax=Glonium stellatum TaxID=574774 RepID=A0A8E2EQ46_9PEZI|nr:hypothetical protein AOQ84DRAFT_422468 [Glonium stellatum]